jgi:hypothetical protein
MSLICCAVAGPSSGQCSHQTTGSLQAKGCGGPQAVSLQKSNHAEDAAVRMIPVTSKDPILGMGSIRRRMIVGSGFERRNHACYENGFIRADYCQTVSDRGPLTQDKHIAFACKDAATSEQNLRTNVRSQRYWIAPRKLTSSLRPREINAAKLDSTPLQAVDPRTPPYEDRSTAAIQTRNHAIGFERA